MKQYVVMVKNENRLYYLTIDLEFEPMFTNYCIWETEDIEQIKKIVEEDGKKWNYELYSIKEY